MTVLDDRLIPRTLALIEKYGKLMTFALPDGGTYDPTSGAITGDSSSSSSSYSYSQKATPPEAYVEDMIDGENVYKGDMRVWLPAHQLAFEPQVNMTVTIDATVWNVMNVEPVYTGERIAMYGLQLRK